MSHESLHLALDHYKTHVLPHYVNAGLSAEHAEHDFIERAKTFSAKHNDCFERSQLLGHVTGSAFIYNPSMAQVALTLHKKLNLWLQFGGHSDGDPRTDQVALREAQEESGLLDLSFYKHAWLNDVSGEFNACLFDIDVHDIPERGDEPLHQHYDIRFVLVTNTTDFSISNESKDLRWFTFKEAHDVVALDHLHRQLNKLECIASL